MHWGQISTEADQPQRNATISSENRDESVISNHQIIPQKRHVFKTGKTKSEDANEVETDLATLKENGEKLLQFSMSVPTLEIDAKAMIEVMKKLSMGETFQENITTRKIEINKKSNEALGTIHLTNENSEAIHSTNENSDAIRSTNETLGTIRSTNENLDAICSTNERTINQND